MKSLRNGVVNCSSQIDGCTPVSQKSNAISFASCHVGTTRCTRCSNSSKQNKKKRCGYQCRQKCQNLCVKVGQTFLSVSLLSTSPKGRRSETRASVLHKTRITAATKTCIPISRAGCAKFSANKTINALKT